MLALYRAGRQTEALDVYREFRGVLREELGLETSPLLRELEAAILRHDPALSLPSRSPAAPLARRPVTVVCVVLQAASDSGTALDPETHEVVNERAVSSLAAVVEQYGGKLAISTGERFVGVFGVASVHEDDALRAARASLEARSRLASEAEILLRRHGAGLACRFGLATGEALVGGSGPLGFAGDVGTRAVTLAEAAEPGQILISCQTRGLAGAALEAERAGPDQFVLRSAHVGARPLALYLDAPLVGRDQEMHRLEAAYARATRERVTTVVTVIGEAGVGKTRLVHEVAERLSGKANVLTGRCVPYGEGITFWPLREVVRQACAGHGSPEAINALLDGEADATGVADRLSRALGSSNQGSSDAAEIFWAARGFLRRLRGPSRCWSSSRTCTGPNPPSSTWWNPSPFSRGDRRLSSLAPHARSCWNSVRPGPRERQQRCLSISRHSPKAQPHHCWTRWQEIRTSHRPLGHGFSRPLPAIPSISSSWRSR